MYIVFWVCWAIDLLLCAITVVAKNFADSFHSSGSVPWGIVILFCCTAGGFLLQVVFKKPYWALGLAAFPLLAMLVWYLSEKAMGKT